MMKAEKIIVPAALNQIAPVTEMINKKMEELNCSLRTRMHIRVAVDEIISNIVHYAYGNRRGTINVEVEAEENPPYLSITFIDQGVPFNPLTARDPELAGSAKQRPVGGLGLYIVKKTMDMVYYEYKNNSNILIIRKYV